MGMSFGLLGRELGHSFSVNWFRSEFARRGITGYNYSNLPISEISELPALLKRQPDLTGFNVTIPYKESIIAYLNELSPQAEAVGAVNCVKIKAGRLIGYNTDVYGFKTSLLEFLRGHSLSSLILGSGGAAKAAAYVLKNLGFGFTFVSRTPGPGSIGYGNVNASVMASHHLIINATPVGMFPDIDSYPAIDYDAITPSHYLFDMVYNPPESVFLQKGHMNGAKTMNGLRMLELQAQRSLNIWLGTED